MVFTSGPDFAHNFHPAPEFSLLEPVHTCPFDFSIISSVLLRMFCVGNLTRLIGTFISSTREKGIINFVFVLSVQVLIFLSCFYRINKANQSSFEQPIKKTRWACELPKRPSSLIKYTKTRMLNSCLDMIFVSMQDILAKTNHKSAMTKLAGTGPIERF